MRHTKPKVTSVLTTQLARKIQNDRKSSDYPPKTSSKYQSDAPTGKTQYRNTPLGQKNRNKYQNENDKLTLEKKRKRAKGYEQKQEISRGN